MKHGVGGQRPPDIHPGFPKRVDNRGDKRDFLVPHGPAFPGVGIEAPDSDAGGRQVEHGDQRFMGDLKRFAQQLSGQRPRNRAERNVDRHRHDAQFRARQHHDRARNVAKIGQKLGMSGKCEIGAVL